MKTANKIFYSVVLAKLFAIGLVVFAATSQGKFSTQISTNSNTAKTTIIEQTHKEHIKTVIISTKRHSMEEKFAMNLDQAPALQANTQYNKKLRKLA